MKTIFFSLFLFVSFSVAAQDSSRVEQYCEVVATGRLLSNKVTIDIDYGEARSFWKDHRLKDEEGNLKKFNSIIDALNYLGKLGWKMVNAFPAAQGNGSNVYHYIFKKEFARAETE